MIQSESYLETELNALIQQDTSTFKFLQEGSLDGLWYWDLDNPDNEWMSPEFWRVLGIDPTTKAHSPSEWQDLIFAEDLPDVLKNFDAHCADPDHPYDQIVRYRHADGSTVWIRCRGLAIRDDTGKTRRMLGAHTNLTTIKRSEQNARAGWRAAQNANAELKSFAYSVSHDMKAPANTLKLLLSELELQSKDTMNEDSQALLAMSLSTIDRMQSLVENVLDYTRMVGAETMFEPTALRNCAQAAIDNLMADIETSGAEIHVGDLPELNAAKNQMNALFQNLISNAIKYRKPDQTPIIHIALDETAENNDYNITFTDNGIGIDPRNHDRIFTLFQRLHTYEDIEGVGIGLPMCKRIALNHHGNMTVKSDIGDGTTFTVSLPRRPQ